MTSVLEHQRQVLFTSLRSNPVLSIGEIQDIVDEIYGPSTPQDEVQTSTSTSTADDFKSACEKKQDKQKTTSSESSPPTPQQQTPSVLTSPPKSTKAIRTKPISAARMSRLSPEQKQAYDRIVNKHENTVILGVAGSGKSLLIHEVIDSFEALDIAVSATTGSAGHLIRGCTFHRLFGVGILQFSKEQIWAKLSNSKYGAAIIGNLQRIRICIIDEISMMSQLGFETIDYIAQQARESSAPFGGLQMVLVGDFCQIKPVAKKEDHPLAKRFTFQSDRWLSYFPIEQHIQLSTVFRQEDPLFQSTLDDFRNARYTENMRSLVARTKRALQAQNGVEPTHLYCTRNNVAEFNLAKLRALPGTMYELKSMDVFNEEGSSVVAIASLDREVPAERMLQLKVGAQVMVIKNLNVAAGLFNGTRAVVVDIDTGGKTPRFIKIQLTNGTVHFIERESFDQYGLRHKVVASRTQFPLALAWAMTVHRSQGTTLDYVVVDLEGCWECGQAYVAVSRVKTIDGLQITGFSAAAVKQSEEVKQFYNTITIKRSRELFMGKEEPQPAKKQKTTTTTASTLSVSSSKQQKKK